MFADPTLNGHWRAIQDARQLQPLHGPFQHLEGYGFMAHLPEHEDVADDVGHNMRSTLMLFENGRPMGLAHALHDVIKQRGGGRFAHWQKWMVFSAIDNTDPNLNARSYTYCLDY